MFQSGRETCECECDCRAVHSGRTHITGCHGGLVTSYFVFTLPNLNTEYIVYIYNSGSFVSIIQFTYYSYFMYYKHNKTRQFTITKHTLYTLKRSDYTVRICHY